MMTFAPAEVVEMEDDFTIDTTETPQNFDQTPTIVMAMMPTPTPSPPAPLHIPIPPPVRAPMTTSNPVKLSPLFSQPPPSVNTVPTFKPSATRQIFPSLAKDGLNPFGTLEFTSNAPAPVRPSAKSALNIPVALAPRQNTGAMREARLAYSAANPLASPVKDPFKFQLPEEPQPFAAADAFKNGPLVSTFADTADINNPDRPGLNRPQREAGSAFNFGGLSANLFETQPAFARAHTPTTAPAPSLPPTPPVVSTPFPSTSNGVASFTAFPGSTTGFSGSPATPPLVQDRRSVKAVGLAIDKEKLNAEAAARKQKEEAMAAKKAAQAKEMANLANGFTAQMHGGFNTQAPRASTSGTSGWHSGASMHSMFQFGSDNSTQPTPFGGASSSVHQEPQVPTEGASCAAATSGSDENNTEEGDDKSKRRVRNL
jgi:hypothetical protein